MQKQRRICFLVFLSMYLSTALAQNSFIEYVEKTGKPKIIKQIQRSIPNHYAREDGMGMGPYLTRMEQAGPIALVAFNLNSESYQTTTKTTWLSITYSLSLSKEGGNAMANHFHEAAIAKMKARFLKEGISLLTPSEFYSGNKERAGYYTQFEPERTKAFGNIMSRGKAETAARTYAPLILSAAVTSDYKTKNSYGFDLSTAIGVNACMLFEINLIMDKKSIALQAIRCAVVGKNPTPFVEGKKYISLVGGYPKGQVYFEGKLELGKKGVPFVIIEKEKVTSTNYEGFGTLMECFAEAIIQHWKGMISKNS